nr:putative ribonuclease h protein [Quercus suber]
MLAIGLNLMENQVAEYFYCVLDHATVTRAGWVAVGWKKPQVAWAKLNTDGSVLGSSGLAGGGGIIRDCHGEWISGFSRSIGITSSFAAECWALRDGLRLCLRLGITAVEVEVDASSVVSVLANAAGTNSEIDPFVDECRDMLKRIPQARLKHCYRESNKCADRLARLGTEMEEEFFVFDTPPPVIVPLLFLDKMGTTQDRICNEVGSAT